MAEKEPQFTVTDRRKFTLEGDLREGENADADSAGTAAAEASASPAAPQAPAGQSPAPQQASAAPQAPAPAKAAETRATEPAGVTEESAQQHYHAATREIDDFMRQTRPGEAAQPATFAALVQSLYMTAMFQLGAGGDPNEEVRVDLMGARESIDMMGVLAEKTKGNLTEDEQRLVQNALFGLRMSFLETANAIAAEAQKQPGKTR